MNKLILIPARAGSKGLPGKNTKQFFDKPLISHTIDFAIKIKEEGDIICISSNDEAVITIAKNYEKIFILRRPEELSTDTTGMSAVMQHAVTYFQKENKFNFDSVLLLQPTSPLRILDDYKKLQTYFKKDVDLVVSVKESKSNPYFNLFEENECGYIEISKKSNFERRQDCPKIYEYNGSMYMINTKALIEFGLHGVRNIKKIVMPIERSVDIDDINDWEVALYYKKLLENK